MIEQINLIKSLFRDNWVILGDTKARILDELDMAIFQHRKMRDTPAHEYLLQWGMSFLTERGVE